MMKFIKILVLMLAGILLTGFPEGNAVVKKNTPKTSAEAKKRRETTRKEIKQTEEELRANEAKVKKELVELGKIEGEITKSKNKIKELNGLINGLNVKIGGLEKNISENEASLKKLREEYLKAVKRMRITKKNHSDLAFVFSSASFNQALRRMRYLEEFSGWQQRQSSEINAKIADLRSEKEKLSEAREDQKIALQDQKKANSVLEDQYKKQADVTDRLKANSVALSAHLKKKQAEARELDQVITALIADEQRKQEEERRRAEEKRKAEEARLAALKKEEEQKKAAEMAATTSSDKNVSKNKNKNKDNNKGGDASVKSGETVAGDFASARKRTPRSQGNNASDYENMKGSFQAMKGKLPYPVSGGFTVTSRFGRQSLPDLPNVEYDNPGIDAEVNKGARAQAVFKGNVSGVYLLPGYNTVVIVNHDGYYTVYGNIESASVKVGDPVNAGQVLGVLADAEEDPDHGSIHFEVWKNREKQDPQQWLR